MWTPIVNDTLSQEGNGHYGWLESWPFSSFTYLIVLGDGTTPNGDVVEEIWHC